jgi:hypothetical protein
LKQPDASLQSEIISQNIPSSYRFLGLLGKKKITIIVAFAANDAVPVPLQVALAVL